MERAESLLITKINISHSFSFSQIIKKLLHLFNIPLCDCFNKFGIVFVLLGPKVVPHCPNFGLLADSCELQSLSFIEIWNRICDINILLKIPNVYILLFFCIKHLVGHLLWVCNAFLLLLNCPLKFIFLHHIIENDASVYSLVINRVIRSTLRSFVIHLNLHLIHTFVPWILVHIARGRDRLRFVEVLIWIVITILDVSAHRLNCCIIFVCDWVLSLVFCVIDIHHIYLN